MAWQELINNMSIKITVPVILLLAFYKWILALLGFYSWTPKDRLTNHATKNINSYPKDLKLNDGNLCLENGDLALISGEEAFKQHLQTFISVTVGELCFARDYGCEFVDSIFMAKNKEFQRQCEHLARVILENASFKDYIEEIYQINRRKAFYLWGERLLIIELKVKGRPDTCSVRLFNITDRLKKRKKAHEN